MPVGMTRRRKVNVSAARPPVVGKAAKGRLILLALFFALLDQGSKWLAKAALAQTASLPVIPHVFQLTLTYNTGAAFSLFENHPQGLTGFSILLLLAFAGYALTRARFLRGEAFAFALILGGALGNLLDRLLYGRVTDFLDCVLLHYPVFNVADSFIFCGMALLILLHLRSRPETRDTARVSSHVTQRRC